MLIDLYYITDANNYTTITRSLAADLRDEINRLSLKAPINVVRSVLKHGSFGACYWCKIEEFTVG